MRNKAGLALGLTIIMAASGCADVQKAAEDAARRSGNERLAQTIHGAGTAAGGLLPISYEEEQTIGAAIAVQVVARSGGVVEQPGLVRYVNLVGRGVALTSDRPDIPYHFAVLNDDSINAFAAPGGYIFITRGLLRQIRNEAELAAVLGHEIGHVSKKHILEVIQRTKVVAGVAEGGLAYANQNPQQFKNVIDTAVKKLFDEGLDQDKETEADSLGAMYAQRVGYDATAYVALLTRLRTLKGDDRAFFKTHPNFSTRINAVQSTIQSNGWKPNGTLLTDRFALSGRL